MTELVLFQRINFKEYNFINNSQDYALGRCHELGWKQFVDSRGSFWRNFREFNFLESLNCSPS